MGASVARAFPSPQMSDSFFGNNLQKLVAQAEGRRPMPSGPLLPRLPRNPYAIAARKIGRLSTPYQPKRLDDIV